mgnify:CR=1 FL=1
MISTITCSGAFIIFCFWIIIYVYKTGIKDGSYDEATKIDTIFTEIEVVLCTITGILMLFGI